MIASLVLATFVCTMNPETHADKCDTKFEEVWVNQVDYKADVNNCSEILAKRYPEDITGEGDNPLKYGFAGCYRVMPGRWFKLTSKSVYLQNVDDADDSFIQEAYKLEVK